jgi:hypothetical protein
MRNLYQENLRLLQEIEESVKDILEEAEKEIRAMSPQQRADLFGAADLPFFDDPEWGEIFPIGSEEEEEDF